MVSHRPAKFVVHRQCGSGDMFLVVEEQNSLCACLNPPLLFITVESTRLQSKRHIMLTRPILAMCALYRNGKKYTNKFCQSIQTH